MWTLHTLLHTFSGIQEAVEPTREVTETILRTSARACIVLTQHLRWPEQNLPVLLCAKRLLLLQMGYTRLVERSFLVSSALLTHNPHRHMHLVILQTHTRLFRNGKILKVRKSLKWELRVTVMFSSCFAKALRFPGTWRQFRSSTQFWDVVQWQVDLLSEKRALVHPINMATALKFILPDWIVMNCPATHNETGQFSLSAYSQYLSSVEWEMKKKTNSEHGAHTSRAVRESSCCLLKRFVHDKLEM